RIAGHVGAVNAKPTPREKTLSRRRYGFSKPSQPIAASAAAARASHQFITQSNFRRSTMSAKAPAGMIKRKKGNDATADMSERSRGDELSLYIAQTAAHSCAATQIPESTLAHQSLRKAMFRRARSVELSTDHQLVLRCGTSGE